MSLASRDSDANGDDTWAAEDAPSAPAHRAGLERGQSLGRYVVLERLGAGGMGIVYAAYDPELDRKVALKILHPGFDSGRLSKEAQALARLNHPHVVTVHDAGEHDGRVFVAMEYVAGVTLRAWLGTARRPWREIVAVLVRAGSGLAAAHAKGLVHRDFKPDNVMVDDDGRVLVMDFGLAHPDPTLASADVRERDDGEVTLAGIAGTPAYMAPEQHLGQLVDARSDQFAYCVTLFEALFDRHPFEGDHVFALIDSITHGRVREPSAGTRVPGWVLRVIRRGLAVDPAARYPSMAALLDALADDPTRRRRRFGIATAIVGLAAIATVGWQVDRTRLLAQCEAEGATIDEVWNDTARARVHAAFLASDTSLAADTAQRVEPWLDRFAAAWRETQTTACLATRERDPHLARLRDATIACLDERRRELGQLIEVFAAADPEIVRDAVQSAARLPAIESCTGEVALARRATAAASVDDATVQDMRRELAALRIASTSRSHRDQAAQDARALLERAQAIGFAPLLAEIEIVLGAIEARRGAYEAAQNELVEAWLVAQRSGYDEAAVEAATALVQIAGYRRAHPDEGLLWGRQALAVLQRSAASDDVRHGTLAYSIGMVHGSSGRFEQAREHLERARQIQSIALGDDHPDIAATLINLGNAARATGRTTDAQTYYRQAIAIQARVLGPEHPDIGRSLNSLGALAFDRGDLAEALDHFTSARDNWQRVLGPEHPDVASMTGNIAAVYDAQGRHPEGLVEHRRALEILQRALDPDHPDVGLAHDNLGVALLVRRDFDGAQNQHERALAIHERALGRTHPAVATTLSNLGNVAYERGDRAQALPYYEEALQIRRSVFGDRHRAVADALNNRGLTYQALGDHDRAEADLREALALREALLGVEHADVAAARNGLGGLALDRGAYEEALAEFERAVAIRERVLGPDHPHLARSLTGLGRALVALGRRAEAIAPLERALAIRERADVAPSSIEETQAALTQARGD